MGNYIAHRRRKIRDLGPDDPARDAGRSETLERQLALRRETERLEGDRSRAAKMARAFERQLARRTAVDGALGRRRTAVRVAGSLIISATVGLRASVVAIQRSPNSGPSELWAAEVGFENEDELAFRFYDPMNPASIDVIRLMRYAAPRIAEEIYMGSATPGADDNNTEVVKQLAESCVRKVWGGASLSEEERRRLVTAIISDWEATAALRLRSFDFELMSIGNALMQRRRISRRECQEFLSRIHAGFDALRNEKSELSGSALRELKAVGAGCSQQHKATPCSGAAEFAQALSASLSRQPAGSINRRQVVVAADQSRDGAMALPEREQQHVRMMGEPAISLVTPVPSGGPESPAALSSTARRV